MSNMRNFNQLETNKGLITFLYCGIASRKISMNDQWVATVPQSVPISFATLTKAWILGWRPLWTPKHSKKSARSLSTLSTMSIKKPRTTLKTTPSLRTSRGTESSWTPIWIEELVRALRSGTKYKGAYNYLKRSKTALRRTVWREEGIVSKDRANLLLATSTSTLKAWISWKHRNLSRNTSLIINIYNCWLKNTLTSIRISFRMRLCRNLRNILGHYTLVHSTYIVGKTREIIVTLSRTLWSWPLNFSRLPELWLSRYESLLLLCFPPHLLGSLEWVLSEQHSSLALSIVIFVGLLLLLDNRSSYLLDASLPRLRSDW